MLKQKLLIVLMIVSMALGLNAQVKVQGFPYNNPKLKSGAIAYGNAPAGEDFTFTFDKIQNWTGTGSKKAALVLQWNDPRETNAMVFGFKWDGEATTEDMIKAICAADPRLYCLLFPENNSGYGNCLGGFGWDADEDGETSVTRKGVLQIPVSPGIYETDDYYFDDYKSVDPDDYSGFGWYDGNWGIFIKDKLSDAFILAPFGISSRKLVDGCMDGINFAVPVMDYKTWKPFAAAPALIPEEAKTDFFVNGIYYKLKSFAQKTVEVVAPFEYEGQAKQKYTGDIIIPETFEDKGIQYKVVAIGNYAFDGSQVKNVTLPKSVTKLGNFALSNSHLTSINLTDVITSIGEHCFDCCFDLHNITIPSSIDKIAPYAFSSTGLTAIEVPASVKEIGEFAFSRSRQALTITLHENLEIIGTSAFLACIQVQELTIPRSVKKILSMALVCPQLQKITTTNITPLEITDDVFYPDTYNHATLCIPMGFKDAYSKAAGWKNFGKMEEIPLPVTEGDLFYKDNVYYKVTKCAGKEKEVIVVHYPVTGEVTSNAIKAANKAGYTGAISIPEVVEYQSTRFNVVAVADSAFYGAAMTSLDIKHTETIGTNVCAYSENLTTVTLSENLKEIPDNAFEHCVKLVSINKIPALEKVGTRAFFYCKQLQWPEFGDKLTTLGTHAFYNCSAITEITYPKNVTVVPEYIFDYCESLTTVTLHENITSLGSYCFANCNKLNSINIPSKVTEIPSKAFYKAGFTAFTIPQTVTQIGNGAFSSCSKLAEITLHEGLEIGSSVFEKCTSLKGITLPESLTVIPSSLFNACTRLRTVNMSNNVTSIGANAFSSTALKSFEFPTELTSIGRACFDGCSLMTSVQINDKVKTLTQRLFAQTNLQELVIPSNVTSIESNLIYDCEDPNIKVWLCSATPAKISNNRTFMTSNNVYATLTVPYGTTDTYKNTSSSWANNPYKEITPVSTSVATRGIKLSNTEAVLTGIPNMTYAEPVPEKFAVANNIAYVTAKGTDIKVAVEFRKANSSDEYTSVESEFAQDSFTAQLNALTANTEYEYKWKVVNASETTYSELGTFKTKNTNFSEGFFILNEDWFGHNNSSINFVTAEGEFLYNVFQAQNEGSTLGVTSQYGTIYGDKMFIMSKQNAPDGGNAGGRIIVTDAKTMKQLASVNEIGGADGRAYIGVSDKLGYAGTSNGIYLFDTENYVVLNQIEGTGSADGGLYSNQVGDMVRYQDYVFAAKQSTGVLVIDTKTNKLVTTIPMPKISTVFVTYAGGVYASDNEGFHKINPYTFETELISIPSGKGAIDSWSAWQPAKVTSDLNEDVIYYATGSSWSAKALNKLDLSTGTLTENFSKFPGNQSIYGNVTTNPTTGEIITTTNLNYSNANWLYYIDPVSGELLQTVEMKPQYWFPSMEIYPDNELPVVSNTLDEIKLDIDFDQTFNTPLLELVSDADNYNVSITAEIKNIKGENFMNAQLVNGNLVIKPIDDGEASFDLIVNSNGKYVTKNVTVSVIRSTGVDDTFATQSDIVCNNGILRIQANTEGTAQIFNVSGQLIMSTEVVEGSNEFSLSDLTDGVYVVKFNNVVKKIVR